MCVKRNDLSCTKRKCDMHVGAEIPQVNRAKLLAPNKFVDECSTSQLFK